MNIIIMSDRDECLYGQRTLKRLVDQGATEPCKVVEGINLDLYAAYLLTHFANHKSVKALRSGTAHDLFSIRAISDQLNFTEADVQNLIRFQECHLNDEGEEWKNS